MSAVSPSIIPTDHTEALNMRTGPMSNPGELAPEIGPLFAGTTNPWVTSQTADTPTMVTKQHELGLISYNCKGFKQSFTYCTDFSSNVTFYAYLKPGSGLVNCRPLKNVCRAVWMVILMYLPNQAWRISSPITLVAPLVACQSYVNATIILHVENLTSQVTKLLPFVYQIVMVNRCRSYWMFTCPSLIVHINKQNSL